MWVVEFKTNRIELEIISAEASGKENRLKKGSILAGSKL